LTQAKARTRDPEGRRRALSAAVIDVISDVGVGRVTHRAVATRAGVPLGATTYYYPTLSDLVASGLEELADRAQAEVQSWAEEVGDGDELPATLTNLAFRYLNDRPRALLEYELYLAAARNPHLRPLASIWPDGVRDLLSPITGPASASAVCALIDGFLLQAVVTGQEPDRDHLQTALAQLLA
jgi:DNA-binding transcriptional regulator YbjK